METTGFSFSHPAFFPNWSRAGRPGAFLKRLRLLPLLCALGLLLSLRAAGAAESAGQEKTSAAALFNEGNASMRLGRLGPAVLNYERAHWLAPTDDAITHNLRVAREKAAVTVPAAPAWKRPAYWLSLDAAAILGSLSLLLVCLVFFGAGLIPPVLRRPARGVCGLLLPAVAFSATVLAVRWRELDRAVITAAAPAPARIAPADNAAPAFELKPGETVTAEAAHGAFVRVRTGDGRAGWVASSDLEKILPDASGPARRVSL
ncbi:MAG: SH3 domain-containing protein [Verrucomicrobiaceae bacterium]|nr:MAG: SH3 domain-containing protein [Verrucomicrobiaceae bacterium]